MSKYIHRQGRLARFMGDSSSNSGGKVTVCVCVYALCFIFNVVIILLTLGRLASSFPFPFDKLVIGYNILATVMYMTAMVMWPLYSFRLDKCEPGCDRDKLIVVTFMTIMNSIVYILDTANSIRLVFCGSNH